MIFMAIQLPDPGTGVPADKTGDSPWLAMKKVRENFNDQSNAASRLVGTAAGNVMEVGAFGLGPNAVVVNVNTLLTSLNKGFITIGNQPAIVYGQQYGAPFSGILRLPTTGQSEISVSRVGALSIIEGKSIGENTDRIIVYTTANATKDANGFLKGASPVLDMYDGKIDLNHDATEQGGITFEKLGVGDYLIKGSLGFAQEGWYIETPKDANGNVLVAVVYEQLANNNLSIKTYAKRFDDETGDIVANLTKPRDIPDGRFISLRLHELPKEPPVMPTETQTEV